MVSDRSGRIAGTDVSVNRNNRRSSVPVLREGRCNYLVPEEGLEPPTRGL